MDADDPCAPQDEPEPLRLDAVGLICPAPVLEARKALGGMRAGEVLEIRTDDPLAELDFRIFCDRTGHRLVSSQEAEGIRTTRIQKIAGESARPDATARPT